MSKAISELNVPDFDSFDIETTGTNSVAYEDTEV